MKSRSINHDPTRTTYIQLDTKKCLACWKCLPECKNQVIGRINLPWHKHSRFVNSSACTGCLKCINVCEPAALTKISIKKHEDNPASGKLKQALLLNLGLLFFGLAMSLSGFVIQFKYHMGHNQGNETYISGFGIDYYNWTNVHKISVIIISVLVSYHFILHWKWYKTIITRKLAARNKLQIILTIVFILVAITGYIPWLIDLTQGSEITRNLFIEIHDKLTILLFVFLSIHVIKRLKWFRTTLDRLINKTGK
jgi:ferredoxin